MTRNRTKSMDQTSFGTTESTVSTAQPGCGFRVTRRTRWSTPFQSSSGECRIKSGVIHDLDARKAVSLSPTLGRNT